MLEEIEFHVGGVIYNLNNFITNIIMNKTLFIGILILTGFILIYLCSFKKIKQNKESYVNFEERSTKALENSLNKLNNSSTNTMEKYLLDQKKENNLGKNSNSNSNSNSNDKNDQVGSEIKNVEKFNPNRFNLENYVHKSKIPDMNKYILRSEMPERPNMDRYILKTKLPSYPDMNKYILKTEIPNPPSTPQMDKYILKTQVPKCKIPRLDKFVLKSSVPPNRQFQTCIPDRCELQRAAVKRSFKKRNLNFSNEEFEKVFPLCATPRDKYGCLRKNCQPCQKREKIQEKVKEEKSLLKIVEETVKKLLPNSLFTTTPTTSYTPLRKYTMSITTPGTPIKPSSVTTSGTTPRTTPGTTTGTTPGTTPGTTTGTTTRTTPATTPGTNPETLKFPGEGTGGGGELNAPGSNIIHQKEKVGFKNMGRKKNMGRNFRNIEKKRKDFSMPTDNQNKLRTTSLALRTGRPGTDYLAKNHYRNWKKIKENGKSIWYNIKTKKKQTTTPNVINEYRKRVSNKDLNFNKMG